jgi:hypothetical protein
MEILIILCVVFGVIAIAAVSLLCWILGGWQHEE